jgi:FtsP/CotA-like multicopper oxidase with cupredoxin domain
MDMPADEHAGHEGMAAPSGPVPHGPDKHGPGSSGVAMMSQPRLDDPGIGLGEDGWRVLTYSSLKSLHPWHDTRPPERELEFHLTGNMERYMWSFDGKKFSQAPKPIPVRVGERLKVTLVNDTMMEHPIHLHGMWMELDNGSGAYNPRKHTINVKPAERVTFLATPDVPGKWAFHCHILYHMETGMFRVVEVLDDAVAAAQ